MLWDESDGGLALVLFFSLTDGNTVEYVIMHFVLMHNSYNA